MKKTFVSHETYHFGRFSLPEDNLIFSIITLKHVTLTVKKKFQLTHVLYKWSILFTYYQLKRKPQSVKTCFPRKQKQSETNKTLK